MSWISSRAKTAGIADTCYIGPEPEFFIFDEVRYEQTQHRGVYQIDSVEGAWNTMRFEEPNLGYKPSDKGRYFPASPTDTNHDLRSEMTNTLRSVGVRVASHHHDVGMAGQSESDMQYAPLLQLAHQFMWYTYFTADLIDTWIAYQTENEVDPLRLRPHPYEFHLDDDT